MYQHLAKPQKMWHDRCIYYALYKLKIRYYTCLMWVKKERVWKIFPLIFGCDTENYERGIHPPTTPSCPPTYHSLMSILFHIQTLMASSWWPHPWQIHPSGSAPQIAQALCKLEEHPNRCQACLHTLGEIPTTWNIRNKDMIQQRKEGSWWLSWLRHCATSQKVAGLIPHGVTGIFHWCNSSGFTMALGMTPPLT